MPNIKDMRRIGERDGMHAGLSVWVLPDGGYQIISWGHNKRVCDEMGRVLRCVDDLIQSGRIRLPYPDSES